MIKYFFLGLIVAIISVAALAGFRGQKFSTPPIEIFPDMDRQSKFKTQTPRPFFEDGRADRMPVPGTVPFGQPIEDTYLLTGRIDGFYGEGLPVTVNSEMLARGHERYQINCAVCHGSSGNGMGITAQYGIAGIANFHTDRLREMPEGQIFQTITYGKGQMFGLPHIQVEDRWAIIAYIRALQRSYTGSIDEVPEAERGALP